MDKFVLLRASTFSYHARFTAWNDAELKKANRQFVKFHDALVRQFCQWERDGRELERLRAENAELRARLLAQEGECPI